MRVLIRIDFNGGYRIKRHLETIRKYQGHKIIVCGHYGRPQEIEKKYSLKKFRGFFPKNAVLLENLRFDPREKANDSGLAKELAGACDLFVQDAFSVCHREHASIVGVPKYIKSEMGLVLKKEMEELNRNFVRPVVFVMGGGKTETKLPLVNLLLKQRADHIILGGLIANKVLASGIYSNRLHLPVDAVTEAGVKAVGQVKNKMDILDIGPDSVRLFKEILREAKTIIWNGPMGKAEEESYDNGSRSLARAIAKLTAYKIIGGGEVVKVVEDLVLEDKFDYISTGGGAMLEYLAKGTLPGIEAIKNSNHEKLAG